MINNFENNEGVDTMINTDVTKEEENTMNTDVTTNTNDVPQPFPAPIALPTAPDGVSASDPVDPAHVSLQTFMSTQVQPSMLGQTAVAPPVLSDAPVVPDDAHVLDPVDPAHVSLQPPMPAQVATLVQPPNSGQVSVPAVAKPPVFVSSSQYIVSGGFNQDINKNKKYANRKTGYPNLDAIHSFQPGLYMILSETSAGKTTFTLQLCDQIAIQGEYVLYFALEQSQFYLTSKSLSRQFFWAHREDELRNGQSNLPCYTSLDIRNGCVDDVELNKQEINYAQAVQDRMHVISTNFSGDINEICGYVEAFIQQTGHKPVLVIDYFQIVPPITMPNGATLDTKTSLDQGIHKLKQFQEEKDLTVMVISSLSRQGYAEAISLAHAKESGSLEFTVDQCLGIQLQEISKCNNASGRVSEADKKKRIAKAKKETPRKVEVVYLKDRWGSIGETVYFDYYSAFETFVATDENGNPM